MKPKPTSPSDPDPSTFAFAVTRIASAQICQSVGYTSARPSALNALTDVAARYLRALASSAAASAASSGRTQSALHDVAHALEDLASVHGGFTGAWDPHRPPLASAALAGLSAFVARSDEIPFAKPLPRSPTSPERERAVFTARRAGVWHVPRWLPAFPEVGEEEIGGVVGSFGEVGERMKMGEREIGGEERVKDEERSGVVGLCGEIDGGCLIHEEMKKGLLEKRGRVRFKMGFGVGRGRGEVGEGFVGVDLRSGVCRGGKRVSCHKNGNVEEEEEEDHWEKKRKNSSSDVSRICS